MAVVQDHRSPYGARTALKFGQDYLTEHGELWQLLKITDHLMEHGHSFDGWSRSPINSQTALAVGQDPFSPEILISLILVNCWLLRRHHFTYEQSSYMEKVPLFPFSSFLLRSSL